MKRASVKPQSSGRVALDIALAALLAVWLASAAAVGPPKPDYASQIQPLLASRCYSCHGPDKQKGGLRLDRKSDALLGGGSGAAILPGKASESPLIQNISRAEGATPMPPKGEPLSEAEIALLRAWIDQGADWPETPSAADAKRAIPDHWAFKPITRPEIPKVQNGSWVRTPIDAFILARLEKEGMRLSPEADRRTLIRRLSFDLTGLPPTPEEIDAFERDPASDACERLADRLLASPRYGERWGRHWLDVVHFGETHGFDKDKRRDNAWRYRDYVIDALNADIPYSRFVTEQIAGDVVEPDDPNGIVATGFLAAGPWDFVGNVELREGTMEKERVRTLDRDDMVANVSGTFLSLTVHCARCHDHKFDPISQRDYYQMQAVFAGIERGDRPAEPAEISALRERLAKSKRESAFRAALLEEASAVHPPSAELDRIDARIRELRSLLGEFEASEKADSPTNGYHSALAAKDDEEKWVQVDLGRSARIDEIDLHPARPTDYPDTPGFGYPLEMKIEYGDDPEFRAAGSVAIRANSQTDEARGVPHGYSWTRDEDRPTARYIRVTATKLWLRQDAYVFALGELEAWSEGKNIALGAAVTANDSIEDGRWSKAALVDGFDSRRKLPATGGRMARLQQDGKAKTGRDELAALTQDRKLLLDSLADPGIAAMRKRALADYEEAAAWLKALPSPKLAYAALSRDPREIHLLKRGDVAAPGEEAAPGALKLVAAAGCEFAAPSAGGEGERRAALAAWITDQRNFLAWRSIVNRVWHYHFGRGIIDTPNDFGLNGGRPSHPELLDWLAAEFRDGGQSLKRLHRMIVTSAAYRQSSAPNADFAKADADNRLLWRMNRRHLDAEEIRDAVLAVSGKLDLTMGGPSFDLFKFKDDHSPRYDYAPMDAPETRRRSVYRFLVRSVPDPFFTSLDCADPNVSTPARSETYSALSALALLNDDFMLRGAKELAARAARLADALPAQIERAFALALGRPPTPEERDALAAYANRHGLPNACRALLNANEFVFVD